MLCFYFWIWTLFLNFLLKRQWSIAETSKNFDGASDTFLNSYKSEKKVHTSSIVKNISVPTTRIHAHFIDAGILTQFLKYSNNWPDIWLEIVPCDGQQRIEAKFSWNCRRKTNLMETSSECTCQNNIVFYKKEPLLTNW